MNLTSQKKCSFAIASHYKKSLPAHASTGRHTNKQNKQTTSDITSLARQYLSPDLIIIGEI